jgi:signal transduction histidine kinase
MTVLRPRALELIGQLHDERQRRSVARKLAAELGATDLLVFTPDSEIDVLLPAPGFPQTLSPGRAWRAFLAACVRDGEHRATLALEGQDLPALGAAASDGSVLVLLGGEPARDALNQMLLLVPLLSSAFGRERAAIAMSGHASAAHQAAERASSLATALETIRVDLQAALSRAQQAIRERDAFVSTAVHELNTPITTLKAIAQLQRRRVDRMDTIDRDWVREMLTNIDLQASKVARLVTQLLDISRIEAGHLPLERSDIEIVGLVRAVVDEARARTQRHTFSIEAPSVLIAWVDPLRLEQVLWNVVDNAIKYSPEGGAIEIEITDAGDTFSIGIADEGLGIPDAHRDEIFQRFHRAHSGASLSGLGIGLFVSRQIVDLHGGHIGAENRLDRNGSRFVITLPVRAEIDSD